MQNHNVKQLIALEIFNLDNGSIRKIEESRVMQ